MATAHPITCPANYICYELKGVSIASADMKTGVQDWQCNGRIRISQNLIRLEGVDNSAVHNET